ncbi:MAG: CBS domain-containing protein [Flavobacteriaceae bacterium]|nr:CBS domain-containing protein [Flavobacteriaceae bacterium]
MLDKEQIIEDKRKRLGATIVVVDNEIVGIITDGDIRRMLEKQNDISSPTAKNIMTKNPITVDAEPLTFDVLTTLKTKEIAQDSTGV